ncbi:glycoside hydrolase family 5 protein [Altererythrobacter sp. Z27]|uniref:glycoside hydrolase family 5 protein n=1 Tax=Altererythrobacter sp. Z27 TaxID=3461147 RepID=UPI004044916E
MIGRIPRPAANFAALVAAMVFLALGGLCAGESRNDAGTAAGSASGGIATTGAMRGVNLSGGEFGAVPGIRGRDYTYPSNELIDLVHAKGFELVRIPVRWERIQPRLMGGLAKGDIAEVDRIVGHARSLGMVVVLDLHNYARRKAGSGEELLGSQGLPVPALADVWRRLGVRYQGQDGIWFGLMNEPHGIPADDWWRYAQSVVLQLRASGVENVLLVPGTRWTGAWSWELSGNSGKAEALSDPLRRSVFEVHQYLDDNSSGMSGECSAGSADRVDDAIEWAENGGHKLFFGEIAAGGGSRCPEEYSAMLAKLGNSQAVVGWAAWGGGPWWPADYPFRLTFGDDPPTVHDRYLSQTSE